MFLRIYNKKKSFSNSIYGSNFKAKDYYIHCGELIDINDY